MRHIIYDINHKLISVLLFCVMQFAFIYDAMADKTDSLFKSDAILKMELRSDFSALQKDRTENPEYRNGELVYSTTRKIVTKIPVKLIVRGNFRLKPENCNFPPLLVNFKKSEVKKTIFDNQDKLKLVTPCQSEQYVFEEYLVYKMYNKVTDKSLKVRLAKIRFFDTGTNKKLFDKYCFFIEDKEEFEERIKSVVIEKNILPFNLDRGNIIKVSVFQYIIGNRDWFFHTRHNTLLMQPQDQSLLPFAVPFDFDFSGFVNADYSKPFGVPDQALTKRRIYKGLCFTQTEFEEVFAYYRKLIPEFISMINQMKLISHEEREKKIEYIEYFYTVIESKELFKTEFLDVCETKRTYGIIEQN